MTSPYLPADIERKKACKLVGYPDSGHTGPGVHIGQRCSQAQASARLPANSTHVATGVNRAAPW